VTCPANCPACGAPITPRPDTAGYQCDYCHQAFYPGEEDDGADLSAEQPDDAGSAPACPVCSQPLVHASIAKTPLLFCTQCHGLLLPMHVLPGLIDDLRAALAGKDKPAVQTPPDHGDLKRSIQCPQCRKRMDTHFYAGPGNVIVDSCGGCFLLWFDRGELMRIAHAPDEDDSTESDR
jgi:Zn-finger nucleic acid-binding protein